MGTCPDKPTTLMTLNSPDLDKPCAYSVILIKIHSDCRLHLLLKTYMLHCRRAEELAHQRLRPDIAAAFNMSVEVLIILLSMLRDLYIMLLTLADSLSCNCQSFLRIAMVCCIYFSSPKPCQTCMSRNFIKIGTFQLLRAANIRALRFYEFDV